MFFMALYVALLFIVLTPGVLLRLPPRSSTIVVAITHSLVFAIIYQFTNKHVAGMIANL